jgi:tetratricopeptide (TPR) repeat protein
VSTENLENAKAQYQVGKTAFERGSYRQAVEALEKAVSLVARSTRLGGEMQIWLVTAYEAAEQQSEAIELCQQLSRHPDLQTRKQSKRLLFILQAPRLKTRPEWLTQIPDLAALNDADQEIKSTSQYATLQRPPHPRPQTEPEPLDLSQVNANDNQFIWVALVTITLTLISLLGMR